MKLRPSYFKRPGNFILAILLLVFYIYTQIVPSALQEYTVFYFPEIALVFSGILLIMPLWWKFTNYYSFDIDLCQEKNGFFAPHYTTITPDEITSVLLNQNLLQQLFGVGALDVVCENSEEPEITISGIRNPVKCQRLIMDLAKRASTGESSY